MMTYRVLIPCRSDRNQKRYQVGDMVTEKDFPKYVIAAWLKQEPPVLEMVKTAAKDEDDNGSDTSNG